MKGKYNKKNKGRHHPRGPIGGEAEQSDATANQTSTQAKDEVKPVPEEKTRSWIPATTLVVGVVVCIIYYFQLRAMVQSNEMNRESLETVQGAVVSFSAPEIKTSPASGKQIDFWLFSVPFNNGGSTSTKNGQMYWSMLVRPEPIPDDFTFPDQGSGKSGTFALGPKQSANTPAIQVRDAVVKEVLARHTHMYLYGWATYRDRFKFTPDRRTEFCYEFVRIVAPSEETFESQVNLCEHHNCYDDECPDYKSRPTNLP